jgi:hypothetical protein
VSWEKLKQLGRAGSFDELNTLFAGAPVEQNPDRLIRRIRDEIVEVEDGLFLGKILYRENGGGYSNLGFFALRR